MLSLRFPLACFFSLAFSTLMGEAQAQSIQDAIRIQAGKSGSGISSWYRARNYTPVWSGESLSGLAQFLHSLDAHGLSPALFQFAAWDAQWRAPSADPAKCAEIPRQVTSYQFLDQALQKPPSQFAGHLLQSAPPQDTRYLELVKTLARYRDLSRSGGWRGLPATATPAGPGTKYSALNLLTSRLQSEGDLPGGATNNLKGKIDNRTGEAIKSFQFRHGIEPDGFLGAETLTELNTPVAHRVNELIINLDRLRWMPRTWDVPEHIEVNIAEGALRSYANLRETAVMKVVVGMKSVSETPVFHGKVQDVYFRPTWNVPTSIARRKLIPAALSAPEGPDHYLLRLLGYSSEYRRQFEQGRIGRSADAAGGWPGQLTRAHQIHFPE